MQGETSNRTTENIAAIQALRAIAALSVAACHYELFYSFGATNVPLALAFGEAGVDLFFVISGFIMVYASQTLYGRPKATATFLTRRLIRIVPIYWIFTTIYLVVALTVPQLAKDAAGDFVVASYLFIPWARPDGTMQPLVGQGWSLNYEMMFYLIFSMALFAPRRIAVLIASLVILGIAAAGYLFEFESSILKFWTSRIIVEFVFGMLIAAIFVEGVRLPRWIGWTLLSLGFGLFIASPQLHDWLNGRLLPWGIPAAIMVLAAAMGNLSWPGFSWRWLLLIGDASYSLYLSHAIVIRAMFAALRRLELMLPFWPGLLVSLALCAAVAILLYYAVERPLTRVLRRALVVKPPAQRPTESLAR